MSGKRFVGVVAGLALVLAGLTGCPKGTGSTQPEVTLEMSGIVRGGQGSGVVGGPVSGVDITARYGELTQKTTTDASGGFTLDVTSLFPAGTTNTPAGLKGVAPQAIDLKFSKQGFKSQVETVTFPVPRTEEYTFYLKGEGE